MTSRPRRPAVRALAEPSVLAGTAYAIAMAAVAAGAAWPVYADPVFLWAAATAVLTALAISVAATMWSWPGWLTVVAAIVGLGVLGVGVAVPPARVGGAGPSVLEVAAGAITGWKDLVTIPLPVGSYRNLLMPALVVFLAGTLAVLRLGWRRERHGAAASAVAIAMSAFGLLFGRAVVGGPLVLGPVTLPAARELACGALALVLSLVWLGWRAAASRREALRRAADVSGVRLAHRRTGSDARRSALAAVMVVAAVGIGALVAPAVAEGRTREVLRSGAGPAQAVSRAVTPLTAYRANFADDAFTTPLFTVTPVDGALPERVRIATLSWYDGAAYAVASDDIDARFQRVPSRRDAGPGSASTIRVRVDGLRGIWLPTFGSLERLRFIGADAVSHADAFYYDAQSDAGVQADGVRRGEAYELTATTTATPALESLRAPGDRSPVPIPDSVKTWVDDQHAGTDGAGLAVLVERLRERGYLSHALTAPEGGADWMRALGPDYAFQSSPAGHSLARIDSMFRRLVSREASPDGGSLVAATGDDEQFAVAVALIAQELGFPARVVVGAHLKPVPGGVPACRDGVCTGGNITAWTEVRSSAGSWVPVDVTPQYTQSAQDVLNRQRDPENPTDVRPQSAQEVEPPDPTRQEANDPGQKPADGPGLDGLWAALRIGAVSMLGLLVVTGPFAAVLAAKFVRRRARRRAPATAERIEGGWDEYVDAAVDHGLPAPRTHTRTELAAVYATPRATVLAVEADRAVFAEQMPDEDEAERFWALVEDERRRFAASMPLWRRALAAVSLRSFLRGLGPRIALHRRTRATGRSTASGTSTEGRGRARRATPAES